MKYYKGWKIEKVIAYFTWDINRDQDTKVIGYKATKKRFFFKDKVVRKLTIKKLKETINKKMGFTKNV